MRWSQIFQVLGAIGAGLTLGIGASMLYALTAGTVGEVEEAQAHHPTRNPFLHLQSLHTTESETYCTEPLDATITQDTLFDRVTRTLYQDNPSGGWDSLGPEGAAFRIYWAPGGSQAPCSWQQNLAQIRVRFYADGDGCQWFSGGPSCAYINTMEAVPGIW